MADRLGDDHMLSADSGVRWIVGGGYRNLCTLSLGTRYLGTGVRGSGAEGLDYRGRWGARGDGEDRRGRRGR